MSQVHIITDSEAAHTLRQFVEHARGDDLERANLAFSHVSDLDVEYGQSGKTIRQVWDEYKQYVAKWEAASALLKQLLERARL